MMNCLRWLFFVNISCANVVAYGMPGEDDALIKNELIAYADQMKSQSAKKYEKRILKLRIFEKLHNKAGCFSELTEPMLVILTINAQGKVKKTLTSRDGATASCFRNSYVGARLPAPPRGNYLYAMEMQSDADASKYHSDHSDGGGGGPRMPSAPPKCSSKVGCGL